MHLFTSITVILVRVRNEMTGSFYDREEFEYVIGVLSASGAILLSKTASLLSKRYIIKNGPFIIKNRNILSKPSFLQH
jgi:hypothetical protein